MARVSARPRPERERVLAPARQTCPGCGGRMRLRYENRRTLVTLSGAVRLRSSAGWTLDRGRRGAWRFDGRRRTPGPARAVRDGKVGWLDSRIAAERLDLY